MSVVAWDGKTLAADKLGLYGCVTSATTKLFYSNNGGAVAFVGTLENGLALVDWYMRGSNKDEWPDSQKDDNNWSVLIVAEPGVAVHFYERLPFPQKVEDRFCAWGSGKEFAIGAMAMGADAKTAVEVAIAHCDSCGIGVTSIEVNQNE